MLLYGILIIIFSLIHLLESYVFCIRIAAYRGERVATGYSYSMMISTLTRFLMLAFMPVLGYMVDSKVDQDLYLLMVSLSIFGAALLTWGVYAGVNELSDALINRLINPKIFIFWIVESIFKIEIKYLGIHHKIDFKLIGASIFVYTFYSTSVFISFYFALVFYDLRVTISLLSGVTNGLATVALTFFIEPFIAKKIDSNEDDAVDAIKSVFLGRLIAVVITSQLLVALLFFAKN